MGIQDKVYNYFTGQTGVRSGLNTAILVYQANLGYISNSVTLNWMAIAQDNSIRYISDFDMQNGVATGKYTIV